MITYSKGRYIVKRHLSNGDLICKDNNLNRIVYVHRLENVSDLDMIASRLTSLQLVRSPYVALVYDLINENDWIGIVEESLVESVGETDNNRLRRLYEICSGLASLHQHNIAHGNLRLDSFRKGHLGAGRLCNLAFTNSDLEKPSTDFNDFIVLITQMGVEKVKDKFLTEYLASPTKKIDIAALRDRLAALILKGQHRALLQRQGKTLELGAENPSIVLKHPLSHIEASARIHYDGTRFYITEICGEILVNNHKPIDDQDLQSSCVIALGGSHRRYSERYFLTFDQSHPEVI